MQHGERLDIAGPDGAGAAARRDGAFRALPPDPPPHAVRTRRARHSPRPRPTRAGARRGAALAASVVCRSRTGRSPLGAATLQRRSAADPGSIQRVRRSTSRSGSDPYLAPELRIPKADPVRLDVYGLGVLTYLLVTGQAPGASQSRGAGPLGSRRGAASKRLGRRTDPRTSTTWWRRPPRTSRADVCPRSTTSWRCWSSSSRRSPRRTPPTADAAAGAGGGGGPASETDEGGASRRRTRWKRWPGDVLAGRWEVVRRLGTGSTSRAFLVRDLDGASRGAAAPVPVAVLKVALSEAEAGSWTGRPR